LWLFSYYFWFLCRVFRQTGKCFYVMRQWLMSGCAMLVCLPALALTTPDPIRPEEDRGDSRVRQVWWKPGMVIKLAGAEGQSLMVEMPKGMELKAFMFSQQNIIRPDEYIEVDPATGKPIQQPPPNKEEGCEGNINMKICVRHDRFLFFIPYVSLTTQPFPMLVTEKKKIGPKGKEKTEQIEYSIVFELSTVPPDVQPYYSVKVNMGDPPTPPEPLPLPPPIIAPILPPPEPKPVPPPAPAPSPKPVPSPAPAPSPKPVPSPAPAPSPKTVPMARRATPAPAPAPTPVTPLPPMTAPDGAVADVKPVPRETPLPHVKTAQEEADEDIKRLLANRQNRTPIVTIPPRPGMSEADKARLKELERLALQPSRPRTNDKYTIQGDSNLVGR
jgi:hypothetical protein